MVKFTHLWQESGTASLNFSHRRVVRTSLRKTDLTIRFATTALIPVRFLADMRQPFKRKNGTGNGLAQTR